MAHKEIESSAPPQSYERQTTISLEKDSPDFDDGFTVMSCEDILSMIGMGWRQFMILILTGFAYTAYVSELFLQYILIGELMTEFNKKYVGFAWLSFWPAIASLLAGQIWGMLADTIGRKPVFTVALVFATLFTFCLSFAPNFTGLILIRVCGHIFVSGVSAVDYLYIVELLPAKYRGRWPTLITVMGTFGLLYVTGITMFFVDDIGWRWIVRLASLPLFLSSLFRVCVALESPRFLVSKGKQKEAWKVFEKLCSKDQRPIENLIHMPKHRCILTADNKGPTVVPISVSTTPTDSHSPTLKNENVFVDDEKTKRTNWGHEFMQLLVRIKIVFNRQHIRQTTLLGAEWFLLSLGYWGVGSFIIPYFITIKFPSHQTYFFMICAQLPGLALCAYIMEGNGRFYRGRIAALRFFSCASCLCLAVVSILLVCGLWGHPATLAVSLMVYFFIVPLWNLLYIYTPENYGTSVRATACACLSQIGALPPIFAAFISARAVSLPKEKAWVYPLIWSCVFCVFFATTLFLKNEVSNQPLPDSPESKVPKK